MNPFRTRTHFARTIRVLVISSEPHHNERSGRQSIENPHSEIEEFNQTTDVAGNYVDDGEKRLKLQRGLN